MLDNHPAFKRGCSLRLRKVAYRLKSRVGALWAGHQTVPGKIDCNRLSALGKSVFGSQLRNGMRCCRQ
ncbi:hypothetical protein [Photorhabdus caribbeanensis]|uniref:hypothetical protein n=1 Tax=Photorhabdus caribbeanensis TaxID=1004165 RepID=UPI001BD59387|nr:hypothetical protein [Photorhabdus caribbeanensis]